MAGHRVAQLGTREAALQFQALQVESIDREDVAMYAFIVPGRTRTVVAVIVARMSLSSANQPV